MFRQRRRNAWVENGLNNCTFNYYKLKCVNHNWIVNLFAIYFAISATVKLIKGHVLRHALHFARHKVQLSWALLEHSTQPGTARLLSRLTKSGCCRNSFLEIVALWGGFRSGNRARKAFCTSVVFHFGCTVKLWNFAARLWAAPLADMTILAVQLYDYKPFQIPRPKIYCV